jgi:opacity protein-like surface antigen
MIMIVGGPPAKARVFDFKDESVGTYLHAFGGLSELGQDPFGNTGGSGTSFAKKFQYNFGGDAGFVLRMSQRMALRLGVQYLEGVPLTGVSGTSAAGVQRWSLSSSASALIPEAALEYTLLQKTGFKVWMFGGAGYALVKVSNQYTASATSDLAVASYDEASKASSIAGFAGVGAEVLFTDATTFYCDISYTYLPVSQLTYTSSGTGTQGAFQSGQPLLNDYGSRRDIDLSSFNVGAGFRFYINVL